MVFGDPVAGCAERYSKRSKYFHGDGENDDLLEPALKRGKA
jgi:hypothetical protein